MSAVLRSRCFVRAQVTAAELNEDRTAQFLLECLRFNLLWILVPTQPCSIPTASSNLPMPLNPPNSAKSAAAASLGPIEPAGRSSRSEEHTSELQSLMRISYAVFCLKKKKNKTQD